MDTTGDLEALERLADELGVERDDDEKRGLLEVVRSAA